MNPIYSIVNGEFILKDEAILPSRIFLLCVASVFLISSEQLITNRYFRETHLDRFYFSASEMFMDVGYERNQLNKIIQQLIDRNRIPDSGIRITLTGGYSDK